MISPPHTIKPLDSKPHICRIYGWSTYVLSRPHQLSLDHEEFLQKGASEPCPIWPVSTASGLVSDGKRPGAEAGIQPRWPFLM